MGSIFEVLANLIKAVLGPILGLFSGTPYEEQVTKIRARVAVGCGFLPDVAPIIAILSSGNPALAGVSAVAAAICEAVTAAEQVQTLVGKPKPTVGGVVITGEWIGGK